MPHERGGHLHETVMPTLQATLRRFNTAGIPVHELQATDYPELLAALNHKQAPVVLADGNHWAGYRPDLIDAAIETRRHT